MRILWIHKYILDILEKKSRASLENRGTKRLQANKDLWQELSAYISRSPSSGASWSDYWLLYRYIRIVKPKEVLECGTGVTTMVMAYAMLENERESGIVGRITSMEELEKYYQIARQLLPPRLKRYVEIICSPRVEEHYCLFRGVRYRDVPARAYDFVYVDGPGTKSPSDGVKTFDFDFIRVVLQSEKPVFAIVDTRMSTCWVFNNIFRPGKVVYDYRYDVGLVGPCTKNDLLSTDEMIKAVGPHPVRRRRHFFALTPYPWA